MSEPRPTARCRPAPTATPAEVLAPDAGRRRPPDGVRGRRRSTSTIEVESPGQGHAHRLDGQAAARGGPQHRRSTRRSRDAARARSTRRSIERADDRAVAGPAATSWTAWRSPSPARTLPSRGRAARGPGPAGGLAGGPVPRHPGHPVRPADGGPPAARGACGASSAGGPSPVPGRRPARLPLSLRPAVLAGRRRGVGVAARRRITSVSIRPQAVDGLCIGPEGGRTWPDSFIHLHRHTEYSMLDGAARVGDVVAAAAADGQPAIGITDHGNMYGVLDFYKACRNAGRQADHRHRGLHGPRAPVRAARPAGAGSTTPAATPRAARSSTTT